MTDSKCRELRYNFLKRYVQADSSTDAATMLGRATPAASRLITKTYQLSYAFEALADLNHQKLHHNNCLNRLNHVDY